MLLINSHDLDLLLVNYFNLGSVLDIEKVEADYYYFYVTLEDNAVEKVSRTTILCRQYEVAEVTVVDGTASYLIKNRIMSDSRFIKQSAKYLYKVGTRVELGENSKIYGMKTRTDLKAPILKSR